VGPSCARRAPIVTFWGAERVAKVHARPARRVATAGGSPPVAASSSRKARSMLRTARTRPGAGSMQKPDLTAQYTCSESFGPREEASGARDGSRRSPQRSHPERPWCLSCSGNTDRHGTCGNAITSDRGRPSCACARIRESELESILSTRRRALWGDRSHRAAEFV